MVTNRTGVPLQLMQWRSDVAAETFDDKAGGGTMLSSSKSGLPRATGRTPQPPGIQAAIRDPEIDWTSCMHLPTGRVHSLADEQWKPAAPNGVAWGSIREAAFAAKGGQPEILAEKRD